MNDSVGHVRERLVSYLAGDLPAAEAAGVREHCAACPSCGRLLEESAGTWALLGHITPAHPARSLWPGVQERLANRSAPAPRLPLALGAAGASLAGLLLGILIGSASPWFSRESQTSPEQELTTLIGNEVEPTLGEIYLAAGMEEREP